MFMKALLTLIIYDRTLLQEAPNPKPPSSPRCCRQLKAASLFFFRPGSGLRTSAFIVLVSGLRV